MSQAVHQSGRGLDIRIATVAVTLAGGLGIVAVAASGSRSVAIVAVGALGAAALLMTAAVVTRERVADCLLLGAVACMALPVDKYFAVQEHVGGWPGIRVALADVALIALLPIACLGAWLGRTRNAIPRSVLVVYALILLQYLISFVNASRRDLAAFELLSAVHALAIAGIIAAMARRSFLRPVVALVAIQVVIHTGFAIAQAATGRPIGAEWFSGTAIVAETLETGSVRLRPSGLFDHPIVYADMLLLALPVMFAGLFAPGGRIWRAGLVLALVVGVAGLGLTLSRGAWIGTACAALVLGALAMRHHLVSRRQMARVAIGVVALGLLLAPPLATRTYERLTASNASNLGVRFELNWIAVSMIQAHPFTGVGLSNFIPVMERYDPTNVMRRFPATVHNVYLLEGAEAGIPAMLLFIGLFATILTVGLRRLPHMDYAAQWVAAAIIAALFGFLVTQLADFSHRLEPLRSVIWMNIGFLFALQRGSAARSTRLGASHG
jgi:hypothetical protein